jgi:hypothetical protein
MQLVRRILCIAFLALPPAAHAGGVVVVSSSGASGLWLALAVWIGLQPRPVPEVSPHQLRAGPAPAADSCTFVAGVRHCPLPKPRAEPR